MPWEFLRHLDAIPCEIFLRRGRRAVLFAPIGIDPSNIAWRVDFGAEFVVRAGDLVTMRSGLTQALRRTMDDPALTPVEKSRLGYTITAAIITPVLVGASLDLEDFESTAAAVEDLTAILTGADDLMWEMVASMQADFSLHAHAINVSVLSLAFARHLSISDDVILRTIGVGAILHDVGLARLPASLISVPESELAPADAARFASHPLIGYGLVKRGYGSLQLPPFARIVVEHEERIDGSGRPFHLAGGQISFESELVGLVDAYQRLTERLTGREPVAPFEALRVIRDAGPAFRDDLVFRFIAMLGRRPIARPVPGGAGQGRA